MARLLVVDDEQDVTEVLVHYLRRAEHEVLGADSAREALHLIDQHGMPDAVILDVDMPGMDGFALLEQLRQRHHGLPAMFVTALWGGDLHARIRAAGAAYLAKPCTPADLRDGVQRLLTAGEADASRRDP